MIKLDLNPPPGQLKQFGFVAVLGLPLIAVLVLRFAGHGWALSHPSVLIALGAGVLQLVLLLAGFRPLTLAIYVVLMVVAFPIGFVLSHVLMATVFYLVMTPIGLVFKLVGRDAMGRKFDPKAQSYWHVRDGGRSPASYFKLY
ncbi:MAG: hypothetical protein KDC98_17305 [Planctomycetes bacterium]|nr:hypothetical protein [Planctomycetota bacterium]